MPINMTPRFTAVILSSVFALSACATVDVTSIGANAPDTQQSQSAQDQGNVITRSVMRLYNVFTARGWHEDRSRERVQSAASILLNGLETKTDAVLETASFSVNTAEFLDDIKTAHYHIDQTTKAAEVYINVASSDADLKPELKQLQKALRLSQEAQSVFETAMSENTVLAAKVTGEISQLSGAIEALRLVTDNFGDVVRTRNIISQTQTAS